MIHSLEKQKLSLNYLGDNKRLKDLTLSEMSLCREKTLWSAEVSNDFMERINQRKGAEKKGHN